MTRCLRVGRIDDRVEHPAKGSPVLRVGVATQRLAAPPDFESSFDRPSSKPMAVSTKKLRSSVVLVGAPAPRDRWRRGEPFHRCGAGGYQPGRWPNHLRAVAAPRSQGRRGQRVTERRSAPGPARKGAHAGCGARSSASSPGPRVVGRSPAEVSDARQGETIQIQGRPGPVPSAGRRWYASVGPPGWAASGAVNGRLHPICHRGTVLLPIPVVLRSGLTGSAPRLEVFSCQTGSGNGPSCGEAVAAGSARVASRLGLQRSNAGA